MSVVGAEPQNPLPEQDVALLDGLFDDFLFDPQGAQFVEVKVNTRTVWTSDVPTQRTGWLVEGKEEKPARVFFVDGDSILAPQEKDLKKIDFVAICKKRYAEQKKVDEDDHQAVFDHMRRTAIGEFDSDLVTAAWLHRLGEDALASKALVKTREAEQPETIANLHDELAWSAFAGLVHAYMVRADTEALAHGERLLRLYPAEAKKEYSQAEEIVADLQRRQKMKTFGKAPSEDWPEGFEKWDKDKQVALLIDALDEVDARQWGQPGGVPLGGDRRVAALIALGDPAVPALLDTIDSDRRLTRSVHFWRDFSRDRTVLSVSEAALTAAMSILRVRVFEPASTGDNFTAHGEEGKEKVSASLRKYWKEYGSTPFDERMMSILTNVQSKPEATREAAHNLAYIDQRESLTTTVFSSFVERGAEKKPNPTIDKFKDPTVAEAILTAMDHELDAFDDGPRDSLHDYRRRQIEDAYLDPLIALGDHRIGDEIVRRYGAAKLSRMRRHWAFVAHRMGKADPMREFSNQVAEGKVKLPLNNSANSNDEDQPGNVELHGIVATLISADMPEADQALHRMADSKHPFHKLVSKRVMEASTFSSGEVWLAHPFCVSILAEALNDATPTTGVYEIDGDSLTMKAERSSSSQSLPELLKDPKLRKTKVEERVCDRAAIQLSEMLLTVPAYHPLLIDAKHRMNQLQEMLTKHGGFRRMTGRESEWLNSNAWSPMFLPVMKTLNRVATAEDVAEGAAIFYLEGRSKLAPLELPALASLKTGSSEIAVEPEHVLIVQAEIDSQGKTIYGVLHRGGSLQVSSEQVSEINPPSEVRE